MILGGEFLNENLNCYPMKTINYNPVHNKIRYAVIFTAILTCLTFFIACSGDDDPPLEGVNISMADIAGTWTATSARFNGTEVVTDDGGSVTMIIQSNGRFTLTMKRPGMDDMVFTGQLGFDEQWLAVEYDTDPGEWEYYDYSLTDGKTKFNIGANSEFDFNDDGVDEFVIFFLEFVKI